MCITKADLYSSTMTQYMALALAVAFIIILGLENLIICFSFLPVSLFYPGIIIGMAKNVLIRQFTHAGLYKASLRQSAQPDVFSLEHFCQQ